MAGSGQSLIHLYISYSFPAQCFTQETSPVGVCEMEVICLYYVFFPLGPYSYLCLQPELLSPKLLTYRSACRAGPHAFPTTGQTKCILYLSNYPLHLLFSASLGARTTHMVTQASPLHPLPPHSIQHQTLLNLFSRCL